MKLIFWFTFPFLSERLLDFLGLNFILHQICKSIRLSILCVVDSLDERIVASSMNAFTGSIWNPPPSSAITALFSLSLSLSPLSLSLSLSLIYIYANFIKHNRHFMSTYFLLDPFEFPYYFYRIRGELIYVLSIVVCILSTFCLTSTAKSPLHSSNMVKQKLHHFCNRSSPNDGSKSDRKY